MDMGDARPCLLSAGNLTCHLNKDTEGRTGRNQDDAGTFAKLCGHGAKPIKLAMTITLLRTGANVDQK